PHQARENTLKDALRYLRDQTQVYKMQHRDIPPGYPGGNSSASATEQDFIDQMTTFSSEFGVTSPTSSQVFHYGPYLSKMPANPLTGFATLTISTSTPLPTPTIDSGWIYNPVTQEIRANCTGKEGDGTGT